MQSITSLQTTTITTKVRLNFDVVDIIRCSFSRIGPLCILTDTCALETAEPVVTVDSAIEERQVAECQGPGTDTEDCAAAASRQASPAASPSSDAPREPTSTSSPDTDSPVMINEDVSKR